MAELNTSGFSNDNVSATVANRTFGFFSVPPALYALHQVIIYTAPALGIPGNILSAIVWLRRQVASKNSSAVYLAALAINDLAFLLFDIIPVLFNFYSGWFYSFCYYQMCYAQLLEPVLVLGFSVERLIAILHPLKVCIITYN